MSETTLFKVFGYNYDFSISKFDENELKIVVLNRKTYYTDEYEGLLNKKLVGLDNIEIETVKKMITNCFNEDNNHEIKCKLYDDKLELFFTINSMYVKFNFSVLLHEKNFERGNLIRIIEKLENEKKILNNELNNTKLALEKAENALEKAENALENRKKGWFG